MSFDKRYSIELPKLKLGESEFEFSIDNEFFENFEYSPIAEGSAQVKVLVHKYNTHIEADIHIEGYLMLTCDRCTEPFKHNFQSENRVIYTFRGAEEAETEEDEIIYISKDDHFIELAKEIFDFIVLQIPIRKVPSSEIHQCPEEVLRILGLIETEGENPEKEDESIDPRWAKLKDLNRNKETE